MTVENFEQRVFHTFILLNPQPNLILLINYTQGGQTIQVDWKLPGLENSIWRRTMVVKAAHAFLFQE